MAVFKVNLTVKDRTGNTKVIPAGEINVDFSSLADSEIEKIGTELSIEDYLKKDEISTELAGFATDAEVKDQIEAIDTLRYSNFNDTEGGVE